uniref:Uncharacterized protein n=1 Tax=Hyaloperonospora arabidopsidis (strain Emoy2) TaxID=559515 RepID=M4BV45_HYAAE
MPKIDLNEVELPELTLTLERKLILLAEIDALVESTLELRSAFAAGGHQLDTSAWKLVKTVDDVRAYRSRRALHGVSDQTGDTDPWAHGTRRPVLARPFMTKVRVSARPRRPAEKDVDTERCLKRRLDLLPS